MTDEEMAERYANENKIIFEYQGMSDFVWQELKEAYLAGLKAGRPEWHKVADGDLPKEPEFLKNHPDNHRYEWFLVATVGKPDEALYSFAKKKWFIDYEEMMLGDSCFKPIAWCEIPTFTDKE